MQTKDQLLREQAETIDKLELLRKLNKHFPENIDTFDARSTKEMEKLDNEGAVFQKEIEELRSQIRQQGNNANKQNLEKKLNEKQRFLNDVLKRMNEAKTAHKALLQDKQFQEYDRLYYKLKNIGAALAKLEAESPKSGTEAKASSQPTKSENKLDVVFVPESKSDSKGNSNVKNLPSWITSVDHSKNIHLSANLLKPENKVWLDNFAAKHNFDLAPLQEDHKLTLTSKQNAKDIITIDKTSLAAFFDPKDADKWMAIIIDLYIQTIKNTPCNCHTIKNLDAQLLPKFEKALKDSLETNALINDKTTINGKTMRDQNNLDNSSINKSMKSPGL